MQEKKPLKKKKTNKTEEAKKTKTTQESKTKQIQLLETKDKYGVKIPSRLNPNNCELSLESDPILLSRDKKFAICLTGKLALDSGSSPFSLLPAVSDTLQKQSHFKRVPETFVAHISLLGELSFLYQSYYRTDCITACEKFHRKMALLQANSPETAIMQKLTHGRLKKGSLHEINDLLSIVPALCNNEHSKHPSRRLRRTVSCEMHLPSYRRILIEDTINAAAIRFWMLSERNKTIRKTIHARLMAIEYKGISTTWEQSKQKLMKFKNSNDIWLNNRLKMDRRLVQTPYNSLERDVLPKMDLHSFLNELHCLPPSYAHEYYVCQAAKEKVTMDKTLHVRPSTYSYKPTAVSYMEVKETTLTAALSRVSEDAACIESLSGFSCDSKASTASLGPGKWLYNWKHHSKHSKLEHRVNDSAFPNEVGEMRKSEEELAELKAKQLVQKIAAINNLSKNDEAVDPRYHWANFVEVDDDAEMLRTDHKEITQRRKKLEAALNKAANRLEREALQFALSQLSDDPNSSLYINPTWKSYVESGLISVTEELRMLVKRDSWVAASPMDSSTISQRCDQMEVERD